MLPVEGGGDGRLSGARRSGPALQRFQHSPAASTHQILVDDLVLNKIHQAGSSVGRHVGDGLWAEVARAAGVQVVLEDAYETRRGEIANRTKNKRLVLVLVVCAPHSSKRWFPALTAHGPQLTTRAGLKGHQQRRVLGDDADQTQDVGMVDFLHDLQAWR